MYVTQSNIEAKLGRSLTTSEASYFTTVLSDMVDTFINNETETEFGYTGVDVTYYVNGTDTAMITLPTVHDITSVTPLLSDGTPDTALVKGTDYFEYPRGATDIYALRRVNTTWTAGTENFAVVAQPGYTAIPSDITHVATEIAINILTADTTNYKSEKVGDWQVTYNMLPKALSTESQNILSNYRRLSRDM